MNKGQGEHIGLVAPLSVKIQLTFVLSIHNRLQNHKKDQYLQCSTSTSALTVIWDTDDRPRIRWIPVEVYNLIPAKICNMKFMVYNGTT